MDSRFSAGYSGTTSRSSHRYQNIPGIPKDVKVLGKIGSGANGSVYRVVDEHGKEAAYKVLDNESGSYIERTIGVEFIREACIYRHIGNRNPGICNVNEIGNGYISMCLAQGNLFEEMEIKSSLDAVLYPGDKSIQSRVFSLDSIIEDMGTLLATVNLLHLENIIHLDIKPENILRGKDGRLILCDMGSAYITPEEFLKRFENSRKNYLAGKSLYLRDLAYINPKVTRQYVAPEAYVQRRGSGGDPLMPLYSAADIWSLGVVFLELLTGYNFYQTIISRKNESAIYGYIGDSIFAAIDMINKYTMDMEVKGFAVYDKDWDYILRNAVGERSDVSPYELLLQEQSKVGYTNKNNLRKVWDMINKMLDPNPLTRITASECLESSLFTKNKKVSKVIDKFYIEHHRRAQLFEDKQREYLKSIKNHKIPKTSRSIFGRHLFGKGAKIYKFMTDGDVVLRGRVERLSQIADYKMNINPQDLTDNQKSLLYFCIVVLAAYAEYYSPLSDRPFNNFYYIFEDNFRDEMLRIKFLGERGDSVRRQFNMVMYFLLVHVFDFDLWV